MKSENIKNVVDRLIKSNEKAILISGSWGIGKTYEIKQYIKSKEKDIKDKKLKIAYSSLFGKNSLDEVNTELYQILHPRMKVLNVITNVAKLVNIGVNLSCGVNLGIDGENIKIDKNIKAANKIDSIIILDDFERKSDNITAEELLGFINNLINQGFKVVVLADLDTEFGKKNKKYEITKVENNHENIEHYISKISLSDDILGFYKEKVFDRIYKITEAPENVIKVIFGDNNKYINDRLMIEFNENIRTAIKVNSLFLQVENYIKEKKYICDKYDVIMKICMYSVIELMTGKYLKLYNEKCEKYDYLKYGSGNFVNVITSYDSTLKNDLDWIDAINDIYINENYKTLDSIYSLKEDNILQSCFYGSDESKKKIIKRQYDLILSIPNGLNYNHATINQFIRDWYCYAFYIDLSFIDKKKLFKKLYELNFRLDSYGESNDEFISLIKEYREYCNNEKKYSLVKKLKDDDLLKLKSALYDFSGEYRLLDEESKVFVQEYLKENDFLLQKIDGDIDECLWEINHLICRIINEDIPELKSVILKKLKEIKEKNKNDNSCTYRIDSLIKQYGLDLK